MSASWEAAKGRGEEPMETVGALWPFVMAMVGCLGLFQVVRLRREPDVPRWVTTPLACGLLATVAGSLLGSLVWTLDPAYQWDAFAEEALDTSTIPGFWFWGLVTCFPFFLTCGASWEFLRWVREPTGPSLHEFAKLVGSGLAVFIGAALLWCCVWEPYEQAGTHDRTLSRLQYRLVEVGDGVYHYRLDHNGSWPTSLDALDAQGYLSDWRVLRWHTGRFVYRCPSPHARSSAIAAHSWPPYKGRAVVLLADGVVVEAAVTETGLLDWLGVTGHTLVGPVPPGMPGQASQP